MEKKEKKGKKESHENDKRHSTKHDTTFLHPFCIHPVHAKRRHSVVVVVVVVKRFVFVVVFSCATRFLSISRGVVRVVVFGFWWEKGDDDDDGSLKVSVRYEIHRHVQ